MFYSLKVRQALLLQLAVYHNHANTEEHQVIPGVNHGDHTLATISWYLE